MALAQEYKGTLTYTGHTWSSRENGEMTFRIRLDDGRMLKIERPMSSHDYLVEEHATAADATLSKIYNKGGEAGMRLSLGLIFTDAHNASLASVTRLDEPAQQAKDIGWGESWRKDFIRSVSLSPHYRVMADPALRRQVALEADRELDRYRINKKYSPR